MEDDDRSIRSSAAPLLGPSDLGLPYWLRRAGTLGWLLIGFLIAAGTLALLISTTSSFTTPIVIAACLAIVFAPASSWLVDRGVDASLAAIWEQVALMRRHRVAHRDLRLANVFLGDDGRSWIIDFGFSELAASDLLLNTDVAELLASSATVVGPDRAAAVAESVVGREALVAARPRLRLGMLSGATRTAMKARPELLDDLRTRVERVGADRSA